MLTITQIELIDLFFRFTSVGSLFYIILGLEKHTILQAWITRSLLIKQRVKKLIHSKHMLAGIGLASFLESTIVPIPLEALLIPLMQKGREQLWLIATIITLGCLIGALVGYSIGYFLFDILALHYWSIILETKPSN